MQAVVGRAAGDHPLQHVDEIGLGSTPFSRAVLRSEESIAQVSPPPSSPLNKEFFFPIAIGLIDRSTVLVSGSSRPSSRNAIRPCQRSSM